MMSGAVALRRIEGDPPIRLWLAEREITPLHARSRAQAYTLTRAQEQPRWLEATAQRIASLLQLPENWDSYGAPRIQLASAAAMLDILTAVLRNDTEAPAVVPSAGGHLQAEWHTNGVDLEVEVLSPTSVAVYYRDQNGQWDQLLSRDLKSLVEAIDRLSAGL